MSDMLTDEQVLKAIEERKLQWTRYNLHHISRTTQEQWMFNHVHTVLSHATKIFSTPIEELTQDTFRNKTNA
jgi:hypothetical protein